MALKYTLKAKEICAKVIYKSWRRQQKNVSPRKQYKTSANFAFISDAKAFKCAKLNCFHLQIFRSLLRGECFFVLFFCDHSLALQLKHLIQFITARKKNCQKFAQEELCDVALCTGFGCALIKIPSRF